MIKVLAYIYFILIPLNWGYIQVQREKYRCLKNDTAIDLSVTRFIFDYFVLWFLALIPISKSKFNTIDSVPLNERENWTIKERKRKLINKLILIEWVFILTYAMILIYLD